MNYSRDPFIREFIFDEEQKLFLKEKLKEKEPDMERAGQYNQKLGNHHGSSRFCDNVSIMHYEIPDISLKLKELAQEWDADFSEEIWFAQFEFIRYEGNEGQTFKRHRDDNRDHSDFNRVYTSVTMIECSDDLVGGHLKIWVPLPDSKEKEKEYVIDLDPFETIIFPAWFDHEATPVLNCRRVVLISWAQVGKHISRFRPNRK